MRSKKKKAKRIQTLTGCFGAFIDRYGHRNKLLFPTFDESKNTFDIHPNKKGMGILARFYIFLIHSKWFNPLGY